MPGNSPTYTWDPNTGPQTFHYGLFVQEVTRISRGWDCEWNLVYKADLTYYEYAWVSRVPTGSGGHKSSLLDDFSTGNWSPQASGARIGLIIQRGVSQFIPMSQEEINDWIASGDDADKPFALKKYEEWEADAGGEWDDEAYTAEEAEALGDPELKGKTPIRDADGNAIETSPGSPHTSGTMPNSLAKPKGWDDEFGERAVINVRELVVSWNDCNPDQEVPEEEEEEEEEEKEEEEEEEKNSDDEDKSSGGGK